MRGRPPCFPALPSYSHTYAYDAVNRLTSDTDSGGASRTFTYDQWGNMATTGAVLSGLTPPSISGFNTNNRLSSSSFNYDNAGNMILQGTLSIGYDANNRQTSTSDSSSHVQASYSYDGLGNRVMKQANGSTTVYVYDAFGQMAAEYTSASSPAPCITCYLSYDHLGSVRMVTDQTGSNIIALHDYVPFGEEITAGSGRSSSYGGTDGVSQRFTGQQRDTENAPALDFFGARYMSPVLGRFASPDPANAGADLTNPQSWNGYAYVLGNPLGLVDPSGLTSCTVSVDFCTTVFTGVAADPLGLNGSGGAGNLRPIYYGTDPPFIGISYGKMDIPTVSAPVTSTLGPAKSGTPAPPAPKVRMFGTHWCGPGGAGPTVNALDKACQQHDYCYDKHGLSVQSNLFGGSSSQLQNLKECNQALCNSTTSAASNDLGSSRVRWYFSLVPFGACSSDNDSIGQALSVPFVLFQ